MRSLPPAKPGLPKPEKLQPLKVTSELPTVDCNVGSIEGRLLWDFSRSVFTQLRKAKTELPARRRKLQNPQIVTDPTERIAKVLTSTF